MKLNITGSNSKLNIIINILDFMTEQINLKHLLIHITGYSCRMSFFSGRAQSWHSMMSSTLSILQLYLSLFFFYFGCKPFLLYIDFQSVWQDTHPKSQAYMLSGHNPKREKKPSSSPKISQGKLWPGKISYTPIWKYHQIRWDAVLWFSKCTFLGLGLEFGTIINSLPALHGTEKFLREPD